MASVVEKVKVRERDVEAGSEKLSPLVGKINLELLKTSFGAWRYGCPKSSAVQWVDGGGVASVGEVRACKSRSDELRWRVYG